MKKRLKGLMSLWVAIMLVVTNIVVTGGLAKVNAAPISDGTIEVLLYTGAEPLSGYIMMYNIDDEYVNDVSVTVDTPLNQQSNILDLLSDNLETAEIIGWRVWSGIDDPNDSYDACTYNFTYDVADSISSADANTLYETIILEPIYLGVYMYTGDTEIVLSSFGDKYVEDSVSEYMFIDSEKSIASQFKGTDGYALTEWKLWYGMADNCGKLNAIDHDYTDSVDTTVKSGVGSDRITSSDLGLRTNYDGSHEDSHFTYEWAGNILEPVYSLKYRVAQEPSPENNFTVKTEVNTGNSWEDNTNAADNEYQWYGISTYNVVERVATGMSLRSASVLTREASGLFSEYYPATGEFESFNADGEAEIDIYIPVNNGEIIRVIGTTDNLEDSVFFYFLDENFQYLGEEEVSKETVNGVPNVYEITINNPEVEYINFYHWGVDNGPVKVKIEVDALNKLDGQTSNVLNTSNLADGTYLCNITFSDSSLTSNSASVVRAENAEFVFTAPSPLVYDGTKKEATVEPASGITGMGEITLHYYDANGDEVLDDSNNPTAPTDAGTYTVEIDVAAGNTYAAVEGITDASWTFTVTKADKQAPALTPIAETISGKNDGKITGLTTDMQYRENENQSWIDITDVDMTFADGTYYVRYKETANYNASAAATVVIDAGRMLVVTYVADGVTVDTVEVEYGADVADTDIPEVPAKEGYTGEWDKEANDVTEDIVITAEYTVIEDSDDELDEEPEDSDEPNDENVTEPEEDTNTPDTGDNSYYSLYVLLMVVSVSVVLTIKEMKKRYQ